MLLRIVNGIALCLLRPFCGCSWALMSLLEEGTPVTDCDTCNRHIEGCERAPLAAAKHVSFNLHDGVLEREDAAAAAEFVAALKTRKLVIHHEGTPEAALAAAYAVAHFTSGLSARHTCKDTLTYDNLMTELCNLDTGG